MIGKEITDPGQLITVVAAVCGLYLAFRKKVIGKE